MTNQQKKKFHDLASSLSPENLSCDGELSHAQIRRKYAHLMKEWRALEKEVGQKVSEEEAWDFWDELPEDVKYPQNEKFVLKIIDW